jgi:hypothetical protein
MSESGAADGALPPRFIHGHVLVMADGHMRSWGPYGKIDNCVRESDAPQTWRDFLNADPMAQEFWCESRRYVRFASLAPETFVEAVDTELTEPCE